MAQFSLSSMTSQSFVVTVTLPGNWQKRFEMALNKNTNATLELRNPISKTSCLLTHKRFVSLNFTNVFKSVSEQDCSSTWQVRHINMLIKQHDCPTRVTFSKDKKEARWLTCIYIYM